MADNDFEIEIKTNAKEAAKDIEQLGGAQKAGEQKTQSLKKAVQSLNDTMSGMAKTTAEAKNEQNANATATARSTQEIIKQDARLKELSTSLTSGLTEILKKFTMIGLATYAITKSIGILKGAISNVDNIFATGKAADKAGISITRFDALGRSMREMGGSAEATGEDLNRLNQNRLAVLAGRGKFAAAQFKELGISLKGTGGEAKKTGTLMLDLAKSLEKKNKDTGTGILRQLGFNDPKTIALILSGEKAVRAAMETQGKYGLMTEKQKKASYEYKAALVELKTVWDGFGNSLSEFLLPIMTACIKAFTTANKILRDNKVFVALLAGILAAVLIPVLWGVATAAWAAIAPVIAAAAPFLALIAAAVALAAVLEDLYQWWQGNDSMIGELGQKFPWLGEMMESLRPSIQWIIDSWKMIGDAFSALMSGDFGRAGELFGQIFWRIVDAWKAVGQALWGAISSWFDEFVANFAKKWDRAVDATGQALSDMYNSVIKWLSDIWQYCVKWVADMAGKLDPRNYLPTFLGGFSSEDAKKSGGVEEKTQQAMKVQQGAKDMAVSANKQISQAAAAPLTQAAATNNNAKTINANANVVNNITINATDTAAGAQQAAGQIGQNMDTVLRNTAAGIDNGTRG